MEDLKSKVWKQIFRITGYSSAGRPVIYFMKGKIGVLPGISAGMLPHFADRCGETEGILLCRQSRCLSKMSCIY